MNFIKKHMKALPKILIAAVATAVISINPSSADASVLIRDIDSGSAYAKASIIALAGNNIISGDENGNFHPMRTVTRGEMVKMIVKALDIDTSNLPEVPTFSDVPESHWAFNYVEAGYREGIIKGVTPSQFGINEECTREQMVTMFVRSLGLTEEDMEGKQPYLYLKNIADKEEVSSCIIITAPEVSEEFEEIQ